jgi:hypothetical protein
VTPSPADDATAATKPADGTAGSHKLWGGRFASGPSPLLDALNRSIGTDFRLWPHDVRLSKAWALALEHAGVLTLDESQAIDSGLDRVAARIANGAQPIGTDEDIHTMIDRLLHEEAGAPASRLHTGRSRNDQVATASRLWAMDACVRLDTAVRELQESLLAQAETLRDAILPAYTALTGYCRTSGRSIATGSALRQPHARRRCCLWDPAPLPVVRSRSHACCSRNRWASPPFRPTASTPPVIAISWPIRCTPAPCWRRTARAPRKT